MSGTIGDWRPVIDWFNAVTCGFIIGWWMRAIYGWATGRSVRPTVRAIVIEKDDEAPLPPSATPVTEPSPAETAKPNHGSGNRDRAGND